MSGTVELKLKEVAKKFIPLDLYNKITLALAKLTGRYKPFIPNVNSTDYNKNCLLAYITSPFTRKTQNSSHQNRPQAVEIARIIGEFGYNVDVAQYSDEKPLRRIKKKYDLIIDISPRENGFWSANMNEGCKTVMYMTGSSYQFAYKQESKRLEDVERRKGVRLQSRRSKPAVVKIESSIERANAVWFIGNRYNLLSYGCFNMPPVYFIKNTGYNFGWVRKDIIRDKRNFLFFASSGQVHKGLDLLLDIFSEDGFPCKLYICSGFTNEDDFCAAYHHELYECPNIFPVGWVDINGQEFRRITENCAFVIMPSCSEGIAGSVLTAMSAGLIAIVSRECGYYDGEAVNLPDCKIGTIRRYVLEYSQKPDEWIREHSAKSIETATTTYSFESFSESVREAMRATIGGN